MNVWYIALWVYMLAGEAILLAIAFDICRKEAAKDKRKPTEGVSDGEPDKAAVLKTALVLYHINAVYTSRGGQKAFKRPHVSKF